MRLIIIGIVICLASLIFYGMSVSRLDDIVLKNKPKINEDDENDAWWISVSLPITGVTLLIGIIVIIFGLVFGI